MKILIVEDDKLLASKLKDLLDKNGYFGIVLEDFQNSLEQILNIHPDLILLDINIPNMSGENLLKELRKKTNTPVIMVTSRNSLVDEALSITYGADDYITKPYNPNILLLRIGAVLKRVEQPKDIIKYKDIDVNIQSGILKGKGISVTLTKNEMIIFNYLLMHKNTLVTRDTLMTNLWNNNEYINDNALTVNISRLRVKLKELGISDAIETRKGMGYILS